MSLILLLSLPALGRGSGGHFGKWSVICAPLIGIVYGLILGVYDYWLIAFALTMWIAEKPSPAKFCTGLITDGYQHIKGRGYALWEIKYLRDRPWLGVTVRGFISFLIFLPLAYFHSWAFIAWIVVWPLALWIGSKLPFLDAWENAEILRYPLIGLALYLT
jgi:hypothetical protein